MNPTVAALLGVFLFCMGLFLGMVGSFFQTLPAEMPRHTATAARAPCAAPRLAAPPTPVPAPAPPTAALSEPVESVENALVDALRTLAGALASQPPPASVQPVVPVEAGTAPEPVAAVLEERPVFAPRPFSLEPAASPPAPPPFGGDEAYDDWRGWPWVPEEARPYGVARVVEIHRGGFVTVRPGSRRGSSAARRATPSSSVIDPVAPHSSRAPAWSSFSNRVKSRNPPASERPQSSVIDPRVSGNNRMPAWFQETRK